MRDNAAKWMKVRKMEPKDAFGGRRLSVRGGTDASCGSDPNKEPC